MTPKVGHLPILPDRLPRQRRMVMRPWPARTGAAASPCAASSLSSEASIAEILSGSRSTTHRGRERAERRT